MKEWKPDHPKAKLMARKRNAILDAAKTAFLRDGYGGTNMEAIAAAAGVSIMTLYRHADGKDDLFDAVIANACHPQDEADQAGIAEIMQRPLNDILIFVGQMFQERVSGDESITLLRAVMVETRRFPHLADMAYRGLIRSHEDRLDAFLAERVELSGLDAVGRRQLAVAFFHRLIGVDLIRVLLGLPGATDSQRLERSEAATAELLAAVREVADKAMMDAATKRI